jgi:hypothetical protein
MTFIDWSDREAMVGLLLEFVQDEKVHSPDAARRRFLEALFSRLETAAKGQDTDPTGVLAPLTSLYDSIEDEFKSDPAAIHLRDCIEELQRITRGEER